MDYLDHVKFNITNVTLELYLLIVPLRKLNHLNYLS